MDVPICPRCNERPRVWQSHWARPRYATYCKPCNADAMKVYRSGQKSIKRETPAPPKRPDDGIRAYRLKIIERAHQAAMRRRR